MLNLVNGTISRKTLFDDMECLLSEIDLDFVGYNGEEYFSENGISYFMEAKIECNMIPGFIEKIEHLLNSCKSYSCNYYDDFEYFVENWDNDNVLVAIAVSSY